VEAGTALLVGTEPQRIVRETFRLLDDAAHYTRMSRAHNPFGDGKASHRIRDILRAESKTLNSLEKLRYAS
jgi:UDP-N-acetylglucosamine 2-epimerase (non-hydrolysing)